MCVCVLDRKKERQKEKEEIGIEITIGILYMAYFLQKGIRIHTVKLSESIPDIVPVG